LGDETRITSDVWTVNDSLAQYRTQATPGAFAISGVDEPQPPDPAPVDDGRFWGQSRISNSIGVGIR